MYISVFRDYLFFFYLDLIVCYCSLPTEIFKFYFIVYGIFQAQAERENIVYNKPSIHQPDSTLSNAWRVSFHLYPLFHLYSFLILPQHGIILKQILNKVSLLMLSGLSDVNILSWSSLPTSLHSKRLCSPEPGSSASSVLPARCFSLQGSQPL